VTAWLLTSLVAMPRPAGGAAVDVEPWSDPGLPVRDGLVLWLDATRQPEACAATDRPAPVDGAQLGVWYDGSGARRDLVQRERGAQPRFMRVGAGTGGGAPAGALVRFDGVDDVLAATGVGATLAESTLFVRAAPRSNGGGFRALAAAHATGRSDYTSGFTVDLSWAPTLSSSSCTMPGPRSRRACAAEDRASVERWLAAKWTPIEAVLERTSRLHRVTLEPVKPETVRFPVFLAPGFSAREVPVDLMNVNNVRYREDGKLVALAYDGDVWLLADRDGLEETAHRFFENHGSLAAPIGMALTPPGFRLGRSLFVACKGKVVLLADQDGDDVAEREIVVASGWAPGDIPHNVDALGVALAPDGRLFFGLGAADDTNACLVDGQGATHYDLASERGAILEVAPDFSSRRIYCTGIRFPVALAFDRAGELFATDQEGATWLANDNPFDELLHIEVGRHYGFPSRHPVHLPGVIDEPASGGA
jgi:hypothetical protein